MRTTTLLRRLVNVKHTLVTDWKWDWDSGEMVLSVKPSWRRPRCSGCRKRRVPIYDSKEARYWRHLDFGDTIVRLCYGLRRVSCVDCGIVAERVPWATSPTARFTTAFEQQAAYLAQRLDKTTIAELMRIAWRTVGGILERVVARLRPADVLAGLTMIGVDEISYRKGHRYLTVVVDHVSRRVVWARKGRSADTLAQFFAELGPKRRQRIKLVTMDMSAAYISAVRKAVPHAQIVFDRFHVQQLVNTAVDKTRREEWQRLRTQVGDVPASELKGMRWAVLKRPWNLTPEQADKLSTLSKSNGRLYRAYLLKESFADILDRRQPNVVKAMLTDWLSWASRSRLPAFVKVARTIRKHLDDIVAYIRNWRLTNAVVEGLNNTARLASRRAYGFHSAKAMIAMIMLCCGGVYLQPTHEGLLI